MFSFTTSVYLDSGEVKAVKAAIQATECKYLVLVADKGEVKINLYDVVEEKLTEIVSVLSKESSADIEVCFLNPQEVKKVLKGVKGKEKLLLKMGDLYPAAFYFKMGTAAIKVVLAPCIEVEERAEIITQIRKGLNPSLAPTEPQEEDKPKEEEWIKEQVRKDNLIIGKNETDSEEVKELKDSIKTDEEVLKQAEKEEENREPEAGEEVIFNADAPKLEEEIQQAKAELDKIQKQQVAEQEKNKGFREAIYKSEIISVCFFNYLEGTKDTTYRDQEGYEYQSNALNFDILEINKIKELKRIDQAATDAAEDVEKDKLEAAFKETEKAVKEWEDTYKETAEVKEVVKEAVSFLTVKEANGAAYHNSEEVYEDMKAEAQIDRECMWVLHLVNGKVLKKELVAMGRGNAAYTTPREVYRRAIIEGATKIIMVHNHPSGDPTPSDADISTCEMYIKAGELLGIGLLDFLVIGTQGYSSFADKGIGGF